MKSFVDAIRGKEIKCQQKQSLSNLFVTYREFVKKLIRMSFKYIYLVRSIYIKICLNKKTADTDNNL